MRGPFTLLFFLATTLAQACQQQGSTQFAFPRTPPAADGDHVIQYDVHVTEDDRDCGAAIPFKESEESLVVEWHSDTSLTMYARDGLYVVDVLLNQDGTYTQDQVAGPCRMGSHVAGRISRQDGESNALCRKRDCDVRIHSVLVKAKPDAGPQDAAVPDASR